MKKLKAYFEMLVTAVICLAMSLIPGKSERNNSLIEELLEAGQVLNIRDNKKFSDKNYGNYMNVQKTAGHTGSIVRKNLTDTDIYDRKRNKILEYKPLPVVGPGDLGCRQRGNPLKIQEAA